MVEDVLFVRDIELSFGRSVHLCSLCCLKKKSDVFHFSSLYSFMHICGREASCPNEHTYEYFEFCSSKKKVDCF